MELMRQFPDKHFELAIVDPPYGIGEDGGKNRDNACATGSYLKKDWDKEAPSESYFIELNRVCQNVIIWGANYFALPFKPTMGWVFWDKQASGDFSDGELAYTSFDRALRKFEFAWMGMRQGDMKNKEARIHPTQKPVALYRWLLHNYAKPGDKILDTHLGSGSIAIACHEKGFDLTGSELDADYFAAMQKRLETAMLQTTLL